MRLFIGVAVDQRLSRTIHRQASEVFSTLPVRAVREEDYHITLCFLGQRSREEALLIQTRLQAVRIPSVSSLRVSKVLLLPDQRFVRAIALGCEDTDGSLEELRERILKAIGHREKGVFLPHVTIGRAKGRVSNERLSALSKLEGLRLECPSFVLYQSILERTGSRYTELQRYM